MRLLAPCFRAGSGVGSRSEARGALLIATIRQIRDAGPAPGGMLHFGIPTYRLPRVDLMAEIARIEAMGVRIVLNHKVTDLLAEKQEGHFDAAFVAIGAHVSRHIDIPARDAARVLDAISLLREVSTGENPLLGRRVVIYGGGNTAMDAARTARRLGAEEALIVYRRDRAHTAHEFEADEALSEGVKIKWLTTIKDIGEASLTVELMELGLDALPRATGKFETLQANAVVLALGQETESSFLRAAPGIEFKSDGTVIVGPDMMTGAPGVFAGGDMVPSERTVTVAVGHGKLAARNIDAWLRGAHYQHQPASPVVSFAMLNLPMFSDADPTPQRELSAAARVKSFAEVLAGLTEPEARREAQRRLSCGNCFECDNCYAACPEEAIIKLGPSKRYRYDYAKMCLLNLRTRRPAEAFVSGKSDTPSGLKVGRAVLAFLKSESLHPADFTIRADGVVRLNPELAPKNLFSSIKRRYDLCWR